MTRRPGAHFNFAFLIIKESFRSFTKNNNFDRAASLAYYGFFAFIPLFFIVLSFLSMKELSPQLLIDGIEGITGRIFPQFGKVITDEVYFLARHRSAVGLFGFVILFWSITPLINATRNAFSEIFNVDRKVAFLKTVILDIVALSVIILLFVTLLISELYYETFLKSELISRPFLSGIIDYVAPFVVTFVCIFFYYIIFSPRPIKTAHLLLASLFASLFWITIKELFSSFLVMNPHYGFAFGSLRAIFVIIVWSFFSFCILLFGAEIMANMRTREIILLKKIFFRRPLSKALNRHVMEKFVKRYAKGEKVYETGEPSNNVFSILSGKVGINKNGEITSILDEGAHFGDLSMFLDEPRDESATAMIDDTSLLMISRNNFETIIKEHPLVVFDILKEMALRIKTDR